MTSSTRRFKRMVPALGTFIKLELEVSELDFMKISSCVFDRIHDLENKLSYFKPTSEISKINQAKIGDWVSVGRDTLTVLKIASELEKDSGGAFSAGNHLIFADSQVQKTGPGSIDLGGIAKGYCVDQAWIEVETSAKKLGIEKVYGSINAGGDLYMHERAPTAILIAGKNQKRTPHLLRVGAVATSSIESREGSAARYPKAKTALKDTVSIEAPSATIADALTKVALFHDDPEPIIKKWNAKLIYED